MSSGGSDYNTASGRSAGIDQTDEELLRFALGSKSVDGVKSNTSQRSQKSGNSPASSSSSSSSRTNKTSSKPLQGSQKSSSSSKSHGSSDKSDDSSDSLFSDDCDNGWGFGAEIFIIVIILTILFIIFALPSFDGWMGNYLSCAEYRLGARAFLFFIFALLVVWAFFWFRHC